MRARADACLEASLEQIAVARDLDPELARAQIVLVTDGEAAVSEGELVAARATLGDLPVGISVIALGRRTSRCAASSRDSAPPDSRPSTTSSTTPSSRRSRRATSTTASRSTLAIERARDAASLGALDADAQARRELGVDEGGDGAGDGRRARLEAHQKDRVALAARYARWFPEPKAAPRSGAPDAPAIPPHAGEDVEAVACALASVAEALAPALGAVHAAVRGKD